MRPVIFISGRSFSDPRTGLQRRTHLICRALGEMFAGSPRYLVAPLGCDMPSWQSVPIVKAPSRVGGAWDRFSGAFLSRIGAASAGTLLRIHGRSQALRQRALRELLRANPKALVWVYRSDYLGLIRERISGQRWICDTNDSQYHLLAAYGWQTVPRRLFWADQEKLAAKIASEELSLAGRYDKIVAICRRDHRYFASGVGHERLALLDTCVLGGQSLPERAREFDIGFLGSDHEGSVAAARVLISMCSAGLLKGKRVAIAGSCSKVIIAGQGYEVIGEVADANAFWRRCCAAVLAAPQRTGVAVKFQEAVANGVFVVAIKGAAEWSWARCGVDYIEVDSLKDIPGALIRSTDPVTAPDLGPDRLNEELRRIVAD